MGVSPVRHLVNNSQCRLDDGQNNYINFVATQNFSPLSASQAGDQFVLGRIPSLLYSPVRPQRNIYLADAKLISDKTRTTIKDSPERAQIPKELKWDLERLYPDVEAWKKDVKAVAQKISAVPNLRKNFAKSAKNFYETIKTIDDLQRQLYKTFVYAQCILHTHTDNDQAEKMFEQMQKLETDFTVATSFLKPAILNLSNDKLAQFRKDEPLLEKDFGYYLDKIIIQRPHILPANKAKDEAKLKSAADKILNDYHSFYNKMPRSKVKLSGESEPVEASNTNYGKYRTSANRDDRKAITEAFLGDFIKHKDKYVSFFNKKFATAVRDAEFHGYENVMQAALAADNVNPKTYDALVAGIENAEPVLYRYMELRKKMLGLNELKIYDLYAIVVPESKAEYSISEAKDTVLKALTPLGNEYQGMLQQAFKDRWADLMPHDNKQAGTAYMEEKYPDAPFILINFNQTFTVVKTIAHELGHAMHSVLTAKNNAAYNYARYPLLIAEVPSAVNEFLLTWHMIEHASNKEEELSYLMYLMEIYRQSAFRQTQFAKFEKAISDKVQGGKTLTAKDFNEIYANGLKETYGPSLNVDEIAASEWVFIPHFMNYNFYVQNYAACMVAALIIARRIKDGEPGAREAYLEMLGKGGSADPVGLLQTAGIDMTSTKPYESFAAEMTRTLDRIEVLWNEIQSK